MKQRCVVRLSLTLAACAVAVCLCQVERVGAAGDKTRVFVTDSQSWEISGGFGGSGKAVAGSLKGGARPQTVEIIKTFEEKCPAITITIKSENADYVVLLDHEGGKGFARKDNKVAVFNKEGDSIHSKSTRSLGNSIKGACEAILKDMGGK